MKDLFSATLLEYQNIVQGVTLPWMVDNLAFYHDDHLQGGKGWIGPGPADTDAEFFALLEPAFISQNVIKRIVLRKVAAVTNIRMRWGTTLTRPLKEKEQPTPDEQARIALADAILQKWTKRRKFLSLLQFFQARRELCGRAGLRGFIPPGLLDADGILPIPPGTPEEKLTAAALRLFVECPQVYQFHVTRDPKTMADVGIYLYSEEVSKVSLLLKKGEMPTFWANRAELSFERDGLTYLRVIGNGAPVDAAPLTLDGLIWHFETVGVPLITEQIRSLQRLLNFAKTVSRRNLADNGWLEEFLINAQVPTESVDDGAGGTMLLPKALERGPGLSREVVPVNVGTAQEPKYLPADVKWRPIIEPSGSIAVADDAEKSIHKEAAQLHALSEVSSNVSGETLKQQRADFEVSLQDSRTAVQEGGEWMLNFVLTVAAHHAGLPGYFDGLTVMCEPQLNTGPITSSESTEIGERFKNGLLSAETAMALQGVENTDAEKTRMDNEGAPRAARASTPTAPSTSAPPGETSAADTPAPDEQQAGIQAEKPLNGAQITAALEVFDRLAREGDGVGISAFVAIELLTSVGIPRSTAETMVEKSAKKPVSVQ